MSFQAKNKAMDKVGQAVAKVWPLKNPLSYTQGLKPYRAKKWLEARECFERAVKEKPGHAPSYFKLGMCHFRLKQYEQARDWIAQALELDPQQSSWKEQLAQTLHHLSKVGSAPEREAFIREQLESIETAALYNELAHALRKQGKWWQEVEALKSAIALEEHRPTWHYRLGEALEVMNRFQEAAATYGRAIELKNGKAEAAWHYRQGYCFEREGHDGPPDPQAAKKAYRLAIDKDGKLNAKRFGIGVFHQQRGHWAQAREAYQQQLSKTPVDAELRYRLGMAHDRCYEWEDAEACYKNALTIDMQQPGWHYRLGFVLERQEKFSAAAAAYQYAALNREKHTPYWFYRWAYVLEKQGRYEEAAQAYLQTRQQQTLDAPSVSEADESPERGTADIQAAEENEVLSDYVGQFDKQQFIIDALESHLEKDTTDPDHWYQLGNAYERQGNWGKAADAYQHAVNRKNDHMPAWYYRLGYVLTQAGQYNEACEAFRNTRVLQKPHGVTEEPFSRSENTKNLLSYAEYYDCLPVKEKTMLFESFNGASITCNPYAIYEYMATRPEYKGWSFVWVVNDINRIPEYLKSRRNVSFVRKVSDAYLRAICQSEFLINNSGFPPYFIRREGQKYLATWHGTPLKTLGKEQKYKFFDHKRTQRNFLQASHIISPNPHTSKIQMESYDIASTYAGKYAETGYPRIDLTVNAKEKERNRILSSMGLSREVPIVLYAPTWRGTLQEVDFNTDKLESDISAIASQGCQVLFRGHSLLEELLEGVEIGCAVVPEHIDTNSLLSIIDVLVTDYSSVFFDFIPLNKPIIYYTYDLEDYCSERGLYFDFEDMPGAQCFNIGEVLAEISSILSSGIFRLRGFENALEVFNPHDDGKASQRVVDFFVNDSEKLVIRGAQNLRKNILFYPGSFEQNGITTSFINLINGIDKNFVNPIVAFNPNSIEKDQSKREQFNKLDYSLDFLPRYGNVVMSLEERYIRLRAEKNFYANLSKEELCVLKGMYAREFKRVFGCSRFDAVVHFSGYDHFWAGVLASSEVSNKTIYLHNDLWSELTNKFPYLNIVFNYYNDFDSLVSVSELTSDLNKFNLSERYGIFGDKFEFCHNLQNPQGVLALANESVDSQDDEFLKGASYTFITFGRLSGEKDHAKLIRSFAAVVEEEPRARLIILGDGPLKLDLLKLVAELKLVGSVHLPGRRSNPFPLLKRADCFVLSSNHEGQPMVLFEAMILKKPIISTDIVGSRSAIEGRTGHLVENTEEGLAQGMQDFIAGNLSFPEYDIDDYQAQALDMFYTQVCDLTPIE